MNRIAISALALLLSSLSVSCGGYRAVELAGPRELAWPADAPRIRLEATIDLGGQLRRGASRVIDRIADRSAVALFERPYAVAWDQEHLLVADPSAGRVARVAPGGRLSLSPDGLFVQPIGVAACDGRIVVTDASAGKVASLDRELQLVEWLAEGLSRPTGIGCRDGRVFVVETAAHRILVRGPDGTWTEIGGRGDEPGKFNFPTTLAIDDGTLLVGDTLNFRVQRLDLRSGVPRATFGRLGDAPGEMPRIKAVTPDGRGHVWVSDAHLDRVSVYDTDGNLLISIGRRGQAAGEFSFPAGIAAHPDGRVAVADSLNRRVQIFRVLEEAS